MIENYDEFEKKLVWIFGTPRSGSTWLAEKILKSVNVGVHSESMIGAQLAAFRDNPITPWNMFKGRLKARSVRIIDQDRPHLFFSPKYENSWKPALRQLILNRLMAQHSLKNYDYLIVRSPNESHGSDIIMKIFPNSRLIFLVRDGRDVIDSRQSKYQNPRSQEEAETPEERRFRINHFAMIWNIMIETTKKAYDAHNSDLKLLVRYEDLRLDTKNEINRIFKFLGYQLRESKIIKIFERTKFENVDEKEKGEDKDIRKAKVGGYKEYFSNDELQMLDYIMGDNLKKFGY